MTFGRFRSSFRKDRVQKCDAVEAIQAYWQALYDLDGIPNRNAVDPRGLETALPYTFILDSLTTRLARVRIAGRKLNDVLGLELRGMPVSSLVEAGSRERLGDALFDVTQMPAMSRMTLAWEGDTARDPVALIILLPLQDEYGRITKILGGLEYIGPVQYGRRFSVIGSVTRPVGPVPLVAEITKPRLVVNNAAPDLSVERKRPSLKLV